MEFSGCIIFWYIYSRYVFEYVEECIFFDEFSGKDLRRVGLEEERGVGGDR